MAIWNGFARRLRMLDWIKFSYIKNQTLTKEIRTVKKYIWYNEQTWLNSLKIPD